MQHNGIPFILQDLQYRRNRSCARGFWFDNRSCCDGINEKYAIIFWDSHDALEKTACDKIGGENSLLSSMRSSILSSAPLIGSTPFSETYFSMRRFSNMEPDAGETTGCSGTSFDTTKSVEFHYLNINNLFETIVFWGYVQWSTPKERICVTDSRISINKNCTRWILIYRIC